ncbi:IS630 family transposase [Neorhodopirellula lusitana]|uniref:IS630 family transposase n=1 Tax=Neorhodopirellula lusitana TaxID=445327 RepID=UPI00384A90D2
MHASEQERSDVKERRISWKHQQRRLDISKLIFLDETGAKTNMTRRYGWGPSDERVTDLVPHGHWKTTTLIHAIDCRGSRASMITNGPTNAQVFEAYVDWLLAPALRPGDILIMDNLSSHKNAAVLEKIRATGAEVRFLPPYSPDLNPIEQIFSKIKAHLRRLAVRTERKLYNAIGKAIKSVTPTDCLNCFRNSGYVAQ